MMKKTVLMMLLLALTMGAKAQCEKTCEKKDSVEVKDSEKIKPEVMPEYPGGREALMSFLSKNIQYPKLAQQYGVEGRVLMRFVVDTDGSLKDIAASDCRIERFNTTKFSQETEARQAQLKEEFALLFAKEGARVIRKMDKWIPGKANGEKVRVKFTLPISFRLSK